MQRVASTATKSTTMTVSTDVMEPAEMCSNQITSTQIQMQIHRASYMQTESDLRKSF